MMRQQGNQFRTDATGTVQLAHLPLGMYEIWPIFRREDAPAASIGSVQPAVVVATRIQPTDARKSPTKTSLKGH